MENSCVEMIRDPVNISATAIAVDCLETKNVYVLDRIIMMPFQLLQL